MAIAWSSSDKEAIERQLTGKSANAHSANSVEQFDHAKIKEVFEVERCTAWIKRNGLSKTTLQFPDSLLEYAPTVALQIEREIGGHRVAILGDTSYGECCVDGVAAEHVGADSVIHFGDTCFSPTERLPVLYIFTQRAGFDINDLKRRIDQDILTKDAVKSNTNVAIIYDVHYHHVFTSSTIYGNITKPERDIPKMKSETNIFVCHPPHTHGGNAQPEKISEIVNRKTEYYQEFLVRCGRLVPNTLVDILESYSEAGDVKDTDKPCWTVVYVGESDIYSQYLALTFPKAQHMLYQPNKKMLVPSSANVTRALMRRHFAIEKTKDAERIGILVGTLAVAKYCDIIDKCRDTIKRSGKKPYTFLVGKPNAPKLANFPEVDVFVIVACPLNSIELAVGNISEGRDRSGADFLRPIITPYELDVALNPKRQWIGCDFKANYQTILPGEEDYIEFEDNKGEANKNGEENIDISLITGRIRISNASVLNTAQANDFNEHNSKEVATQERQLISSSHAGGGGQFLAERSWKGLEQKLGSLPPVLAVQGQIGIANHYVGEGEAGQHSSNKDV